MNENEIRIGKSVNYKQLINISFSPTVVKEKKGGKIKIWDYGPDYKLRFYAVIKPRRIIIREIVNEEVFQSLLKAI